MVNWQITATTIYCDAVDDEVTLLVYADGSVKCTGYQKYGQPDRKVAASLKNKGKHLGRRLECESPQCDRATSYRDKLFAEEAEMR